MTEKTIGHENYDARMASAPEQTGRTLGWDRDFDFGDLERSLDSRFTPGQERRLNGFAYVPQRLLL